MEFLAKLTDKIKQISFQPESCPKSNEFEGEGRIPYPETTDGNWVDHPSKYYKYSNFEEFKSLANVLNDYSSLNIEKNSGTTISIYGWNNVKFYSWIKN